MLIAKDYESFSFSGIVFEGFVLFQAKPKEFEMTFIDKLLSLIRKR